MVIYNISLLTTSLLQVFGFNYVLNAMFPVQSPTSASTQHHDHTYMTKASKIKEAAKTASEQVKAQAEQIYQSYSVKNWKQQNDQQSKHNQPNPAVTRTKSWSSHSTQHTHIAINDFFSFLYLFSVKRVPGRVRLM